MGHALLQQRMDAPSTQVYVTVARLDDAKYDRLLASLKVGGLRVTKHK